MGPWLAAGSLLIHSCNQQSHLVPKPRAETEKPELAPYQEWKVRATCPDQEGKEQKTPSVNAPVQRHQETMQVCRGPEPGGRLGTIMGRGADPLPALETRKAPSFEQPVATSA